MQIPGGEVVENLSRAATATPPANQAQAAGPPKSPTQEHRRVQKPHVWACRPDTEGRVSGESAPTVRPAPLPQLKGGHDPNTRPRMSTEDDVAPAHDRI